LLLWRPGGRGSQLIVDIVTAELPDVTSERRKELVTLRRNKEARERGEAHNGPEENGGGGNGKGDGVQGQLMGQEQKG
jgi:hypothetical protein